MLGDQENPPCKVEQKPKPSAPGITEKPNFSKAFFVLLVAQLVVVTINSMASMGRSLSMNNLEFTATAITSTLVISGIVSLPLPYVIGWLSDRMGRKPMMIICYASYGLCMILLAFAASLWHFWVAVIFLKVGMVSMNVGAAFVTDLVDSKVLGRGISLFQTMGFVAMAIGCAVAGNAF